MSIPIHGAFAGRIVRIGEIVSMPILRPLDERSSERFLPPAVRLGYTPPKHCRALRFGVEMSPTPTSIKSGGHSMENEIGTVAGLIWKFLHSNGPVSIAKLMKEIDSPRDTILLALGWLAREGKIQFETAGRTKRVALS